MHPNNVLARFVDGSDGREERALVNARQERAREKIGQEKRAGKRQEERATAKARSSFRRPLGWARDKSAQELET